MAIQTSYAINPGKGFKGLIARPNEPTIVERGILKPITSSKANPVPGDALVWNGTGNGFSCPVTASLKDIVGILTLRQDTVTGSSGVSFSADDEIFICTLGTVWVEAGGAVEWGSRIVWQTDDSKWDADAFDKTESTAADGFANLVRNPVICVSDSGVDTNLVAARVSGFII